MYARVSSHGQKQKGGLERRGKSLLDYARFKGYDVVEVLEDVARLNENRKTLSKLFDLIERKEIGVVIVVNGEESKDAYQEPVEDLIALVFCWEALWPEKP